MATALEIQNMPGQHLIVDDDVARRIVACRMNWRNSRYVEVRFRKRPGWVRLHRYLAHAPTGVEVDHINGNPFDNRRENLRLVTHSQNMHNRARNRKHRSSQYKGVSLHKQTGKWLVHIKVGPKVRHVGLFADEVDAAHAYDQAAREHFGAFACVNFPREGERSAA